MTPAAKRQRERLAGEMPHLYSSHLYATRRALLARLADAPGSDAVRPYFERGKMLRGLLVFAAAEAVGGDAEAVVGAAEAIELLHGASLFHDDIIDQAAERRGLPALHSQLGAGPALVIGDDLLLRAFAALATARGRHVPERVLDAMEVLGELARECCRGQFDELRTCRWTSAEQYLAIASKKTAAPFVAAGTLGAMLGGGSEIQVAHIADFARQMGIAFQIDDDLLDLLAEPDELGKPAGNSLAQGRPMLPLIFLWEVSPDTARDELSQGEWSRAELATQLERHGIVERVREVYRTYTEAAMAALEGFPQSPGRDALIALAALSTSRIMSAS